MTRAETAEAERILRAVLDAVRRGDLTAPARTVARLEGAATTLHVLASGGQDMTPPLDRAGAPRP